MAPFFRESQVWVIAFTYLGRPRRWLKALPAGADAPAQIRALLNDLYADRAQLTSARPATAQEETDYVRGNLPRNMLCPTGRAPRSGAEPLDPGEPGGPAEPPG